MSEKDKIEKSKAKKESKKLPIPFIVVITIITLITIIYLAWLFFFKDYFSVPDFKTAFWQTIEKNYQTSSLSSKTEVYLVNKNNENSRVTTFVDSRLDINFKDPKSFHYVQNNLVFDQSLSEEAQDLPQLIWYKQEIISQNELIYFNHGFNSQNNHQDIKARFGFNDYKPELNNNWYQMVLDRKLPENEALDLYLMTSFIINGFNYGQFNESERQDLMTILEKMYIVNFENTKQLIKDDQLLYQYQVKLNLEKFDEFVKKYFNLHISNKDSKISKFESYKNPNIVYTLTIDPKKRQITQIESMFVNQLFISPYNLGNNTKLYFQSSDQLLNRVIQLANRDQVLLDLRMTTTILNQDEELNIDIPTKFEKFNINQ